MSGANGVDPFLVAAIIPRESQYDWKAVSRVWAIDLMQVMPATANAVSSNYTAFHDSGRFIRSRDQHSNRGPLTSNNCLRRFSGNVVQTIAAYNAGPNVVKNLGSHFIEGGAKTSLLELDPLSRDQAIRQAASTQLQRILSSGRGPKTVS